MELVALAVVVVLYRVYKLFKVPRGLRHVPAISTVEVFLSFVRGEAFDERFERLIRPKLVGLGMARIWMRGQWDLVVTDVNLGRLILANLDLFPKSPVGGDTQLDNTLPRQLFGKSNIINSDGSDWHRHRRVINPAFKKHWDTSLFGESVLDLFANVDERGSEAVVIHDQFQRLTLDILGKCIFSYRFGALKHGSEDHYLKLYSELSKMIFDPVYFMVPMLEKWVPSRRRGHRMKDEFHAFLKQVIVTRRKEILDGYPCLDLLSLMIKETISEHGMLSDEEVLNDVFAFFFAGHDTTANTLTTILYYISKNQSIQERARQEVLGIVGNNGEVVCPTFEMTKSMKYIDCIIKESMRIVTTTSQLRRHCKEEFHAGNGTVVPKGSNIVVHTWAIHHDPATFPEPNKFNPDRFIQPHGTQAQAWIPFGSGPRKCIGFNFSLTEQRVIVAMLLQRYTMTLGPRASARQTPILNGSGLTRPTNVDIVFTNRLYSN